MDETIWGRNAVWEALRAGHPVNKILIARGTHGKAGEIMDRAREARIPVQLVDRTVLDRLADGTGHQGIFAYLSPKGYVTLDDLLEQVQSRQEDPLLLVLAGWEDPRNFGAIVRSAEAAGAQGVVIPERRAVPLTGVVAKSSAGALEYLPISRVGNLSRTLEQLKGSGFWVVGAATGAEKSYYEADLTGPLALVIGGEGKGLGHLEQSCDLLVRIPMTGRTGSLNAAVAGSIILFDILRQRTLKGGRGARDSHLPNGPSDLFEG
jgi:23S rRNA (guanosine2251-2'-O)-methyltransferase